MAAFLLLLKNMNQKLPYKIGRSSAGLGLFATEKITKGSFVIEYTGEKITTAQANERGGKYLFTLNSRFTIDGKGRENTARYLNHSCHPNCEARIERGHINIYAIRQILPGQELTYDYGEEYVEQYIAPHGCRCRKCRGN